VFYFYQILSSFNKLKTISESVLLLPNTVSLKQVEDYRKVVYFYQILSPLNKLKTISEGVLLQPNTVTLKQVEETVTVFGRSRTSSDIVFISFKGGQYLVEVEHPLI
jgi:hypothetical protein